MEAIKKKEIYVYPDMILEIIIIRTSPIPLMYMYMSDYILLKVLTSRTRIFVDMYSPNFALTLTLRSKIKQRSKSHDCGE